ncbi:saccharopine dehydrogenase NADP-binding domain-containing protein [Streptomyces phaeoluteigriseus]|uniref:Saccharopine dehydrogenase NADP-binding domain-containing protein n=1 Tax=Streptomyces phaeoluteigriseus TaxID=114686 RepID=A0ABY4Z9N7_9ACTN|nr:saccharopine dehydrogenase NADP-binding domain-containing protein [Streptomyces phaeoluteigriseus]USQ85691.1 saccharopine dehydrogenase NADP-binding domain-containing protein [Streptomyces phaeoluteigriseus]
MSGEAPLIGVLGGYGAVGAAAARALAAEGEFRLRIGGRDVGAAARCAAALGGPAEVREADARSDASLERFAHGCDVVLHCAGPAYELADRPRRAAAAAGADYVDVMDGCGPGPAPAGERTAVLSAGLSPGLSGLLPRILTEERPPPGGARFTGYYVSRGAFTRTGAMDYLLSLDRGYGTPRARWRDGHVVPGSLRGAEERAVGGVPHPVTVYPYLTQELVGQARALGLAEARWYNGFDGPHLLDALNRYRAGDDRAGDLEAQAAGVVRASTLDALGRSPYHVLYGVLELPERTGTRVRRVVIRGEDGSALTGVVGAVAAREVARGRVPEGVHAAAQVLPARGVLDALRRQLPGTVVTFSDDVLTGEAVGADPVMEEGVL